MHDRIPEPFRDISVLVNSAGHAAVGRRRFDVTDIDAAVSVIDANLSGLLRPCHAMLPAMVARGRGHIVNIGSTSGRAAVLNDAAYIASKFGVSRFTEALRLDCRGTGVRVTEIRPGLTATGFAAVRFGDPAEGANYYRQAPAALTADDVAAAALFALDQPPGAHVTEIVLVPTE